MRLLFELPRGTRSQAARVIRHCCYAGRLVKTRSAFSDPIYVGDPVNVLNIFSSFEVDEIVRTWRRWGRSLRLTF